MFLEIEQNGRHRKLINVTLADKVDLDESNKTATLWTGGVPLASDSRIAYQFYANRPDELVTKMPAPPKVQSGVED
jgi:hypothetical protein